MRLLDALRLEAPPRLAFVGSGGKSTALFQLARQLLDTPLPDSSPNTVLLAATTHLATGQLSWANRHFTLQSAQDLPLIEKDLPAGVLLFTGSVVEPERTAGLPPKMIAQLYQLAQKHRLPLLLEADGSRQRPLKAPADHEPVIPSWVTHVVVVAGLSALGKPLDENRVHRVECYAHLSELTPGEIIDSKAMAKVLTHPQGGLKSIPTSAKKLALLNQAESDLARSASQRLSEMLLPFYHSVVVASLDPEPQIGPPLNSHSRVFAVHERVAGIILAAGESRRLGSPKQLLSWRGQPFVRHIARVALTAGLSPLVVVTGHSASQVQAALDDLPLVLAHNPDWQSGQSTSVVAGLKALPESVGAALFILVDQPKVSVRLLRSLVELHARKHSPLVAPLIDGKRGNPVLFDRRMFHHLQSLTGDQGGRSLFSRYPVSWLTWLDETAAYDVDTPADFQRLLDG
jgi:molybdenum cofactor cytidylyltransferase